jgi:hypothetical protein
MDLHRLVEIDQEARRNLYQGHLQEAGTLYHQLLVEADRELARRKAHLVKITDRQVPKTRLQIAPRPCDLLSSGFLPPGCLPPNAFAPCEVIFEIFAGIEQEDFSANEAEAPCNHEESLLDLIRVSLYNLAMVYIWLDVTVSDQSNKHGMILRGKASFPPRFDPLSRALDMLELVLTLAPPTGTDPAQDSASHDLAPFLYIHPTATLAAVNNCAFIHSLRCDFANVERCLGNLCFAVQDYLKVTESDIIDHLWGENLNKILLNFYILGPTAALGAPTA